LGPCKGNAQKRRRNLYGARKKRNVKSLRLGDSSTRGLRGRSEESGDGINDHGSREGLDYCPAEKSERARRRGKKGSWDGELACSIGKKGSREHGNLHGNLSRGGERSEPDRNSVSRGTEAGCNDGEKERGTCPSSQSNNCKKKGDGLRGKNRAHSQRQNTQFRKTNSWGTNREGKRQERGDAVRFSPRVGWKKIGCKPKGSIGRNDSANSLDERKRRKRRATWEREFVRTSMEDIKTSQEIHSKATSRGVGLREKTEESGALEIQERK